jgi:quercetin dioxygenase-like cupin family protein
VRPSANERKKSAHTLPDAGRGRRPVIRKNNNILQDNDMIIRSLDKVTKTTPVMEGVRDVTKQLPIGAADGTPILSVRVFTIAAGGHTPYHSHPFEHLNYIIGGEGVVVDAAGKQTAVKTGDFGLILPDEKHQYRNTSPTEDLVMICAVPKEFE